MLTDELHRDEREEKRQKRKKKRVPKLGNDIVVIKNKDKDGGWVENWQEHQTGVQVVYHIAFALCALVARIGVKQTQ